MRLQFCERTSETQYTAQLCGRFEEERARISCRSLPELKVMVLMLVALEGHGIDLRDEIERVDVLFNSLAESEHSCEPPIRCSAPKPIAGSRWTPHHRPMVATP